MVGFISELRPRSSQKEVNRMAKIANVLLNVFNHEAQQARVVLMTAKSMDLNFVPKQGMRAMREVANHVAQIPSLDPAMYCQEIKSIEEAQVFEKKLVRDSVDEMAKIFDDGVNKVNARFSKMTDVQLMKETLQPCYSKGSPKSWAQYLPELTTHLVMHKMQLWMYLKLAGANVDMMTYYGVEAKK
jgi:hypothetical protein